MSEKNGPKVPESQTGSLDCLCKLHAKSPEDPEGYTALYTSVLINYNYMYAYSEDLRKLLQVIWIIQEGVQLHVFCTPIGELDEPKIFNELQLALWSPNELFWVIGARCVPMCPNFPGAHFCTDNYWAPMSPDDFHWALLSPGDFHIKLFWAPLMTTLSPFEPFGIMLGSLNNNNLSFTVLRCELDWTKLSNGYMIVKSSSFEVN